MPLYDVHSDHRPKVEAVWVALDGAASNGSVARISQNRDNHAGLGFHHGKAKH